MDRGTVRERWLWAIGHTLNKGTIRMAKWGHGPFSVIRVTPDLTLQLAPWGTDGGVHLAFALPRAEFDAVFSRIKDAGIPYGDSFHAVGNMQGPGEEDGSRGMGRAVYFFDPNQHLIEIRHYDT